MYQGEAIEEPGRRAEELSGRIGHEEAVPRKQMKRIHVGSRVRIVDGTVLHAAPMATYLALMRKEPHGDFEASFPDLPAPWVSPYLVEAARSREAMVFPVGVADPVLGP